jgi:hypothetical protein
MASAKPSKAGAISFDLFGREASHAARWTSPSIPAIPAALAKAQAERRSRAGSRREVVERLEATGTPLLRLKSGLPLPGPPPLLPRH